ncbi:NADH:ubiquinone reductase (Na(+)-transporting) subunit D [Marivita sp. XM-24bin2]|jgi:Na+-transporting NADH:ubiquinone oxidoreductase subunit D|uniref:NADH:ubiquinone reductase (Na(+)-transporting) subunit D n=1 Tax=unclassified Marivita TaxID=2632480 RepID=UPI000D7B0663|nr:NADH:ubiquinone reductase (Na(+)-transporting) subunit D [Marivita sp. XM-24bin2]MCR9110673.1 NADH:ubiquinone reductase (Na(+)-transporting) subunit D [Paracoccaceae bacterium]PWL33775.1 MAG: NADH:ubiquinone reductase (Na(+)-transporting) subunit D [Marivita sp. XM-24bin2]
MAARFDLWTTLTEPLIRQNPVTLQILGICSALAVTTSLATALTMSISLTVVLTLAAVLISLIRRHIPDTIRLIVQIVIVASLVIVIDQVLQAYFAEISRALSIYVSLITTNCLVLGRTEAYARHHAPGPAAVDAFGNGLGYSLILLIIGGVRELFGRGQLFGWQVMPLADQGGWFTPLSLMLLAPSAFFLLGGLVWAIRALLPEQAEAPEHEPPTEVRAAE